MEKIKQLEEVIKKVQKEKEQAEHRYREICSKERRQNNINKKNVSNSIPGTLGVKRVREDGDGDDDDRRRNNISERESKERDDIDEQSNKRSRGEFGINKAEEVEEIEIPKPKLTSTIVSHGEKQKVPEGREPDVKQRNKKMFGMLLGTLNSFKNDSRNKSEAALKREKREKEIEAKLVQEHEILSEKIKIELQENKEKAQNLRDELKKKQEDLETELEKVKQQTHENYLSKFLKTETKPHLYYKISDKTLISKDKETQDLKQPEKNEQKSKNSDRRRDTSKSESPKSENDKDYHKMDTEGSNNQANIEVMNTEEK